MENKKDNKVEKKVEKKEEVKKEHHFFRTLFYIWSEYSIWGLTRRSAHYFDDRPYR